MAAISRVELASAYCSYPARVLFPNGACVIPVSVLYAVHRGIHGAPTSYMRIHLLWHFFTVNNVTNFRSDQLKHRSRRALPVLKLVLCLVDVRDASDERRDIGGPYF